jgi:5-formyltetrahydrofolate cyclo-ligase
MDSTLEVPVPHTADMTDDAPARKQRLRAELLATRRAMSGSARDGAGEAIAGHGVGSWRAATTVAAYLSVEHEPPTLVLLDALRLHGVEVLLPVIDGLSLDWAPYVGPGGLAPGPLGLSEPATPRLGADAVTQADVVIVPALAVDRQGNRLGRGRGFYDRALIDVAAPIVAVVYDDELIDDVPAEPHDRRVDAVLRPAGLTQIG